MNPLHAYAQSKHQTLPQLPICTTRKRACLTNDKSIGGRGRAQTHLTKNKSRQLSSKSRLAVNVLRSASTVQHRRFLSSNAGGRNNSEQYTSSPALFWRFSTTQRRNARATTDSCNSRPEACRRRLLLGRPARSGSTPAAARRWYRKPGILQDTI